MSKTKNNSKQTIKDITLNHQCALCGNNINTDKFTSISNTVNVLCNKCASKVYKVVKNTMYLNINQVYPSIKDIIKRANFNSRVTEQYYILFKSALIDINDIKSGNKEVINKKFTEFAILINNFILETIVQMHKYRIIQVSNTEYLINANPITCKLFLYNAPSITLKTMCSCFNNKSFIVECTKQFNSIYNECISTVSTRYNTKIDLPLIYDEPTFTQENSILSLTERQFKANNIIYRDKKTITELASHIISTHNTCNATVYFNKYKFNDKVKKLSLLTSQLTTDTDTVLNSYLEKFNNELNNMKNNVINISCNLHHKHYILNTQIIYDKILGTYAKSIGYLNHFMLTYLLYIKAIESYGSVFDTNLVKIKHKYGEDTFFICSVSLIKTLLSHIDNQDFTAITDTISQITNIVNNIFNIISTKSIIELTDINS